MAKSQDGQLLFSDISFNVNKGDKIAILGNSLAVSSLFKIISGEIEADKGGIEFGKTITRPIYPTTTAPILIAKPI